MKKCYLCHSGGYDSTLLLYELCKNAKHNKEDLEVFPIYLKSKCRPFEPEIFHAQKSIDYFYNLYRYDKIIIHPLKIFDYGEIKFNDDTKENEFSVEHHYYASFLVNIAQAFNIKDVTDVFFAFHQGDAIFAYIKDFEIAINSLRRLAFFSTKKSPVGIGNDLFWNNCKDLSFHYPLSTTKKDWILNQYLNDNVLIDKKLAFACECRLTNYSLENNAYTSGHNAVLGSHAWCDKCTEIIKIYFDSTTPLYFFNKINKDEIRNLDLDDLLKKPAEMPVCHEVEEEVPQLEAPIGPLAISPSEEKKIVEVLDGVFNGKGIDVTIKVCKDEKTSIL